MYTVVMMMAMSGSGEVTAFHRGGGRCSGGGCYGCSSGCSRSYGCSRGGCHGGGGCCSRSVSYGCQGGCNGCSGGGVYRAPGRGVEVVPAPRPKELEEVRTAQPATIIVSLPAEAELLVDGERTTSISAVRSFTTPPLEPGSSYFYTLKMNVQRDGRPVTVTKQVNVRAGQESRVTLTMPSGREGAGEESELRNINTPNNNNRDNNKAPPPKSTPLPRDR